MIGKIIKLIFALGPLFLSSEKMISFLKHHMDLDERQSFQVNNRIYVSAGVIPYTIDEHGNYYFLLQRLTDHDCTWSYEDFGGKSEMSDKSIEDVAFRECHEEMNFMAPFTLEFLKEQLKDKRSVIYPISGCKYMLYIIYVSSELKDKMNVIQYGDQNSDRQPRVLEWLSYKSLMELDDKELHPRFCPKEFKSNMPLILAKASCNYDGSQYF